MSKSPISEVLIDATRLLESGELSLKDQQAICEQIRDLIGQETVLCHTRMQRESLVAKAWSIAAGRLSKQGHSFGKRDRMSWDRIRAMFADLPTPQGRPSSPKSATKVAMPRARAHSQTLHSTLAQHS